MIICHYQGSAITLKSPYVCQIFGVCDVRGQIPKSIYQALYLLPSDFPDNFSKVHFEKVHALTLTIYLKKFENAFFSETHQVSKKISIFTSSILTIFVIFFFFGGGGEGEGFKKN